MGDSWRALSDSTQEYTALCSRFGVVPERVRGEVYPFGKHAELLRERARREDERYRMHDIMSSPEMLAMHKMLTSFLGGLEEKGLGKLIRADRELAAWWKANRAEYDAEQGRLKNAAASKERLLRDS